MLFEDQEKVFVNFYSLPLNIFYQVNLPDIVFRKNIRLNNNIFIAEKMIRHIFHFISVFYYAKFIIYDDKIETDIINCMNISEPMRLTLEFF